MKYFYFSLLFLLTACSFSASSNGIFERISYSEFSEKMATGEFVVLDIRTSAEYGLGVLGDPVFINFYDLDFKDELNALDKNKKYLIYCRSGHRTGKALKVMEELGFKEVYDLKEGIIAINN